MPIIEQIDRFGKVKNLSYISINKQKTTIMTVEQLRNHIESDMEIWKSKKSELWKIKDQKFNGTKKSWNELNLIYSHKIQTLQDILIFIDTNK